MGYISDSDIPNGFLRHITNTSQAYLRFILDIRNISVINQEYLTFNSYTSDTDIFQS